jgi:hypothetical protein
MTIFAYAVAVAPVLLMFSPVLVWPVAWVMHKATKSTPK